MSCWNSPTRELNTVVIAPNHRHNINTVELYSIKGEQRINKYTPAVTIVAACINAETGVGKFVIINKYFRICLDFIFTYNFIFISTSRTVSEDPKR